MTSGWSIEQHGFDPERERVWESLCSLGNGHFGGRGTHEERYSGDALTGHYLAGVYYPDPTRVGWWKNGYPDYFAKVLNAADWTPIHVELDGVPLDLATATVDHYERRLDMRRGALERTFRATVGDWCVEVSARRFISIVRRHVAVMTYDIDVIEAPTGATLAVECAINGDVVNEDSNYDEGFWTSVDTAIDQRRGVVVSSTKKTHFVVATAMHAQVHLDSVVLDGPASTVARPMWSSCRDELDVAAGSRVAVTKLVSNVSSRDVPATPHDAAALIAAAHSELDIASDIGIAELRAEHEARWEEIWNDADVVIDGDHAVQEGVRFAIFQLNSTFTGDDPELNIGPKGFTGEKYGGVTYWDTEAFCLPFYLATADPDVSRNLLVYRRRHLDAAIANAEKLGFSGGAALYPMVTINGEECHNEWEITFCEIHRNGAIAFAIYDYLRATGDERYLVEGGLEVLVAIARFWAQRLSWSTQRNAYVLLGVTGPNEYENSVDNNWYTALMAQWTLRYAADAIDRATSIDADRAATVLTEWTVDNDEPAAWRDIADRQYLPYADEHAVFLQHTNYLDKQLLTVDDLDPAERPLNHHWSWDRILRSCFIKQADVLQGLWVLGDRFDDATVARNFDFYEPRTVHESSLSPSIHSVLAARLDRLDKAHEMLRRSARLD
ncbi:MAG: family 65 glycosyl hydrolase domain-containing protein, partial [Actinomycetota bacterium]